jgi:hypothetical protein
VIISLSLKRKKARGSQVLLAKDLKKENPQIRGTPLICSQKKNSQARGTPLVCHQTKMNSQIKGTPLICPQIKILKLGALSLFNLK